MIFGADKQNKNLKEAAAKTKDTSPRTQTSNKYAAKIASNKNNSTALEASQAKNIKFNSKKNINRSDTLKGSKEGLMDGKSTHLQMNNSGYLSKRLQEARYNKSHQSHVSPFMKSNFTNYHNNDIINNYSGVTQKDSSSSRLDALSRINIMWW